MIVPALVTKAQVGDGLRWAAMGCDAFPSLQTGRLRETTRHSVAGTSVPMSPAFVMKYEDICWLRTLKAEVGAGSSCFSFALVSCVKQNSMTGTSRHCWWFHVETTKVLKANLLQETFRRIDRKLELKLSRIVGDLLAIGSLSSFCQLQAACKFVT